jgi:hypothetical protein
MIGLGLHANRSWPLDASSQRAAGSGGMGLEGEGRKSFFFGKKNQKTFVHLDWKYNE